MTELVEMGTVSSRGQIAIPMDIRKEMDLKEGNKVLFVLTNDSLLIKKVTTKSFEETPKIKSWEEVTKPFKEAAKKSNFKQEDLDKIIEEVRKKKR